MSCLNIEMPWRFRKMIYLFLILAIFSTGFFSVFSESVIVKRYQPRASVPSFLVQFIKKFLEVNSAPKTVVVESPREFMLVCRGLSSRGTIVFSRGFLLQASEGQLNKLTQDGLKNLSGFRIVLCTFFTALFLRTLKLSKIGQKKFGLTPMSFFWFCLCYPWLRLSWSLSEFFGFQNRLKLNAIDLWSGPQERMLEQVPLEILGLTRY